MFILDISSFLIHKDRVKLKEADGQRQAKYFLQEVIT